MRNFIVSCCSYCFEDVLSNLFWHHGCEIAFSCVLILFVKIALSFSIQSGFVKVVLDFLLVLAFQLICYDRFVFFQSAWLFQLNLLLLSLALIIPSFCFFSCSFVVSDLSFSILSDDWFSSSLGFSAHLLWLICLFSISLAFSMLWLIFFFPSYWLLQLQLILFWLNYLCFFGILAQFGYYDWFVFFQSVRLLQFYNWFSSFLHTGFFSFSCNDWYVSSPCNLIYHYGLIKVRSWCTLVQLGICTIIWLLKWQTLWVQMMQLHPHVWCGLIVIWGGLP